MANSNSNNSATQVTTTVFLDLPPSCVEYCPTHPEYVVVGTYSLEGESVESENVETMTTAKSADEAKGGEQRLEEGSKEETEEDEDDSPEEQDGRHIIQTRSGSVVAFRVVDDSLKHLHTLPQPSAQLDIHFHPSPRRAETFATVSSTAHLAVFRLHPSRPEEGDHLSVEQTAAIAVGPVPNCDVLMLAFAWHPSIDGLVAVAMSDGAVKLVRLDHDLGRLVAAWDVVGVRNSLEAWCVAFSSPGDHGNGHSNDNNDNDKSLHESPGGQLPATIYSGGDDSILRCVSVFLGPGPATPSLVPPFQPRALKGLHSAGVTAILPVPNSTSPSRPTAATHGGGLASEPPHLILTGSYDDRIRLFSDQGLPNTPPGRPHCPPELTLIFEHDLGGGVWRLKLIEATTTTVVPLGGEGGVVRQTLIILVSCMHAGPKVVELSNRETKDGSWRLEILASHGEHQSMNYGSDFDPSTLAASELRCVSTSFYDKRLCLWHCNLAERDEDGGMGEAQLDVVVGHR